jgi:hypothetical protein
VFISEKGRALSDKPKEVSSSWKPIGQVHSHVHSVILLGSPLDVTTWAVCSETLRFVDHNIFFEVAFFEKVPI